ncbi:hypothetical protein, partial [Rhodococcus sp. LB1]|uniref:hypothetical protein n=1 Tax=Rhodococcus sp. LB1 TaxID=1807499 RepID=UPI001E47FECB
RRDSCFPSFDGRRDRPCRAHAETVMDVGDTAEHTESVSPAVAYVRDGHIRRQRHVRLVAL